VKYLVLDLPDDKLPVVTAGGRSITVELLEFAAYPMVPLSSFRDRSPEEARNLILRSIRRGQESILHSFHAAVKDLEQASPDIQYVTVLVRTAPCCLAADDPAHAIYDPPKYWDEDLHEMVLPEDAVVVGETEGMRGWTIFTVAGLLATEELPDGFSEEEAIEEFPFWALPPEIPEVGSQFSSSADLARGFSRCLGYGTAPEGGMTPAQFMSQQEIP